MSNTIFFQSLGCPKNLVDAEVMLGITKEHSYTFVTDPKKAKVIVVNTCSFINDSKRESINTVLELSQHKERGICERLIVTGCLPQRYKADLKVSFPEVDAFVGTGQYHRILEFIDGKQDDEAEFASPKYIHNENTPRINSQPFYRAYLKVSEGCIKNCAFCIIPKIRGTLRSRSIDSLTEEAKKLVRTGAKELNLIAQDLTDYGRDLKDGTNLPKLLKALCAIDGLEWIRLLYVYPDELNDELLSLIKEEAKICKYIDTPVQHINDRILKLMNRRVTGKLIRSRLEKLKKQIPEVFIRTSVIVGYPGETEEEFDELKHFIQEAELDHLGVFAYSHEENTASFTLPNQIDEETKQHRRNAILEIQQKISARKLKTLNGKKLTVLVEGVSEESEHLWKARHQGQAPDIDGHVLLRTGDLKLGQLVTAKIERSMEYDLIARTIH